VATAIGYTHPALSTRTNELVDEALKPGSSIDREGQFRCIFNVFNYYGGENAIRHL